MKSLKRLLLVIFIVYLLPTFASAGWWAIQDRPGRWSDARWSSAKILPEASASEDAAIYIFSAMTGGLKGAVASHAWIVTKGKGADVYNRYDKVGWGSPIRRNHRPPDAYWYSNPPQLVKVVTGVDAELLIPKVEGAIAAYPYAEPGGYQIFPGPNSNTFVAYVLRTVPELGAVLPPHAVGRDYLPDGEFVHVDTDWRDVHVTLRGLIGVSAGLRSGFEVHFLGLVAGLDFANPGIKVPALGRIGF
ncbi:DUF3750 domain-containing protein [Neorhizobium sp. T786]|uniref:DUF3750 domain-containing protein n=1 Tax=Pseudorhizobium xiangyangii TaxID=2883104 RepID=UPI001CFF7D53|nr:DUF3750 domain-containing protein [Neorhizobium xiangyangii]MCB5202930.1 DUF3750 domain-containing protein [Neorhizobium xiangyangii]